VFTGDNPLTLQVTIQEDDQMNLDQSSMHHQWKKQPGFYARSMEEMTRFQCMIGGGNDQISMQNQLREHRSPGLGRPTPLFLPLPPQN
jgi:hypothetical protein